MKTFELAVAFALTVGAVSPAGAIEVLTNASAVQAATAASRRPDLAALPQHTALPASRASELPEPEVFAMMLLGLVLIGYKATRDSDEKFS